MVTIKVNEIYVSKIILKLNKFAYLVKNGFSINLVIIVASKIDNIKILKGEKNEILNDKLFKQISGQCIK
jgi:hypothetical protein